MIHLSWPAMIYVAAEAMVTLGSLIALLVLGEGELALYGAAAMVCLILLLRYAPAIIAWVSANAEELQEEVLDDASDPFHRRGHNGASLTVMLVVIAALPGVVGGYATLYAVPALAGQTAQIPAFIWAYAAATQPWLPLLENEDHETSAEERNWRWAAAFTLKLGFILSAAAMIWGAGSVVTALPVGIAGLIASLCFWIGTKPVN